MKITNPVSDYSAKMTGKDFLYILFGSNINLCLRIIAEKRLAKIIIFWSPFTGSKEKYVLILAKILVIKHRSKPVLNSILR